MEIQPMPPGTSSGGNISMAPALTALECAALMSATSQ